MEDRFDVFGEAHVEHLVGFVEHDGVDSAQVEGASLDVIDRPTRSCNDDVDASAQRVKLASDRLSSEDR